ncbi:MAG: DUF4935 domain-containing protein [Deltaproteobacteria bacterium]|nr:DUF4935 domain-containing protein [Deltaproteobacteria bacterium]
MPRTEPEGQPVRAVYLDTSILRQCPLSDPGRVLGPLLKIAAENEAQIFVPRTVVGEWVRYHHGQAANLRASITREVRQFRTYEPTVVAPELGDMDEARIRTLLEGALAAHRIDVVETPDVDVADLVESAIWQKPPFDAKGAGFRDAVILETILEHASGNYSGASVVFASADRDFALAEVRRRASARGIGIRMARSVVDAAREISESSLRAIVAGIREAQKDMLVLAQERRTDLLAFMEDRYRPSESALRGEYLPDEKRPFLPGMIEAVVGVEFGEFSPGEPFPSLRAADLDEGRIPFAIHVPARLAVRFAMFKSFEGTKYELPREATPGQRVTPATEYEHLVLWLEHPLELVVSVREEEGVGFTDLRPEAVKESSAGYSEAVIKRLAKWAVDAAKNGGGQ